ncbi:hypothetical protein D6D29_01099 [Aureobasidium pullulans]|nr:hypothetical protein D6D29_01099 [Aureobasidium pullulans]
MLRVLQKRLQSPDVRFNTRIQICLVANNSAPHSFAMSEEPRKRSRFDQTESDARPSRFDRRSRSPKNRNSEPRQRTRSPVSGTNSPASRDPAAAAAAAAAKINAQIQARKGIQHVDVPPIRSTESPSGGGNQSPGGGLNADIYTQDGDFIRDIEVNDLRNRYTLTKGSTQKMVNPHRCTPLMSQFPTLPPLFSKIKEKTGADVTTRGSYYPDKAMATAANPPLYLHVTSTTRDGLEKAVAEIDELMKQDLPNLVDERRFRRREPEQVERDSMGRRKWPEEKIPVDLEPIPGFNLRAQVVGQGGSYVKHIQQETRCRVQIKGRGSGFMEHDTGHESDESMYLHVADGGYGGGYGGYGGAASPAAAHTGAAAAAMSPGAAATPDYAQAYAQYYQQNGQQDPYAAYGGYEAYTRMYWQYYQQQQGGVPGAEQTPSYDNGAAPPPPSSEAPPPPPADDQAPPPPPGASGGYNSVSLVISIHQE